MRDTAEAVVNDAPQALPRDVTRFKSLYPNGRAIIKDGDLVQVPYMTSFEMVRPKRTF